MRDRYCEERKMLDEKHCSSWGCLCSREERGSRLKAFIMLEA